MLTEHSRHQYQCLLQCAFKATCNSEGLRKGFLNATNMSLSEDALSFVRSASILRYVHRKETPSGSWLLMVV
jgi:hypothetical protein